MKRYRASSSERSVFEIVKAPLGWSVLPGNIKIDGVYNCRRFALEAAALAASYSISDGGGVRSTCPARKKKGRDGRSRLNRERYPANEGRARSVKPV